MRNFDYIELWLMLALGALVTFAGLTLHGTQSCPTGLSGVAHASGGGYVYFMN